MRGAGTETDPYQIETIYDLVTEDPQYAKGAYYILTRDLDGNVLDGGIWGKNRSVPLNLDGRGYTIRNVYQMDPQANQNYALFLFNGYRGLWKNVNIENVLSNISLFGYSTYGATFDMENCKISAQCASLSRGIQPIATNCTFNLNLIFNFKGSYTFGGPQFIRCSVKARVQSPDWMATTFTSYYSRIEIDFVNEITQEYGGVGFTTVNSVLALRFPQGQEYEIHGGGSAQEPSVIDGTLWGNCPKTGITNCIFLPTASMKNADRLNEAGFSVIARS